MRVASLATSEAASSFFLGPGFFMVCYEYNKQTQASQSVSHFLNVEKRYQKALGLYSWYSDRETVRKLTVVFLGLLKSYQADFYGY